MLRFRQALLILFCVALTSPFAEAQKKFGSPEGSARNAVDATLPANARASKEETVNVETVWRFSETAFVEPIPVSSLARTDAKTETPESAAVSQISAMYAKDFDWWASGWDEDSRRSLLGDRTESGRTKEGSMRDWINAWAQLSDTVAYLVAKAETPDFVIIAYEFRKANAKGKIGTVGRDQQLNQEGVMRNRLCFLRSNGKWVQSNRFAAHPVWRLWRSGMTRETVLGRYQNDPFQNRNPSKE